MKTLSSTRTISRLVFLIAITLIIEMLGLPQPVTGPLVNMMLFLTSLIISPPAGVVLGAITPIVAALRGQLPGFLLPMIPFIVVANVVLIATFFVVRRSISRLLGEKNLLMSLPAWLGLLCAAFVKYLILYNAARLLLPAAIGADIADRFIAMMSLPQFFTAVAGGVLAFIIFSMLRVRFRL